MEVGMESSCGGLRSIAACSGLGWLRPASAAPFLIRQFGIFLYFQTTLNCSGYIPTHSEKSCHSWTFKHKVQVQIAVKQRVGPSLHCRPYSLLSLTNAIWGAFGHSLWQEEGSVLCPVSWSFSSTCYMCSNVYNLRGLSTWNAICSIACVQGIVIPGSVKQQRLN